MIDLVVGFDLLFLRFRLFGLELGDIICLRWQLEYKPPDGWAGYSPLATFTALVRYVGIATTSATTEI